MDYQLGFVILQKPGFTGRVHPYCISLFKNYIRRSQGERAIFVDPSSIHPLGLPWKDRKVSDFLCSNNAVFLPVSNNSHVMSMINCWERWWWSRKCTFKSDLLYSYLAVYNSDKNYSKIVSMCQGNLIVINFHNLISTYILIGNKFSPVSLGNCGSVWK